MPIKENHITFKKTGRYFTWGNANTAKHLIIALHGYGQLAQFFIRKFNTFSEADYFIVCPEAPHRFYQNGTSGRVGASWMTKEDRAHDIEDYLNYLNALHENLAQNWSFETSTLLGFSQGGATASRWLAYGTATFDTFILWAAVFPPDMDSAFKPKFKHTKNHLVVGTKDEYISLDDAAHYYKSLLESGLNFEFTKFDGNHTINAEALKKLLT